MKIIIAVLMVLFIPIHIYSHDDEYKAYLLGIQGIEQINNKEYKEAIETFNKAISLDPKVIEYHYEKALAFTLSKQGDSAISVLEDLIKWDDATDQIYQLLSTNYVVSKRKNDAILLLKEGLERFPKSGRLYMELAGTEHGQQSMSQVMPLWEMGVKVDPNFQDNYYYLADYFSFTGERLWALIYAEIYLNWLSRKEKREYIARTYFSTFNESCFNSLDTSNKSLRFTLIKIKTANPDEFDGPFEWEYEYCYKKILDENPKTEYRLYTIKEINDLREKFIDCWFGSGLDERFENALFDWQKQIIELGYNDCYGYWLMEYVQPKEFENWLKENEKKYDEFMSWIKENHLRFSEEEAVYRMRYK
jgi:tetratricopeptide (TPR) repeat protein